jgi:peroxiredoxin
MISVGDAAPAFEVHDARGETISLSSLRGHKVVVIFLRHLGCPICRMELAELQRRHGELAAKNAEVIVFVESADESVAEFAKRDDVKFRLVGDPEKRVYAQWGVERGKLAAYLAPGAMLTALKATVRGHMHGRCEGSELQLPGDFIVDEEGNVAFAHRGRHIGDNTPLDTLLSRL